jgi:polysaccharide export outer membrane protein
MFASTSESLLIGPGDQLHVAIVDTPELDQHPRVTDSGEVPIEGVGDVKVVGLTPSAAAVVIGESLIRARYMNHPAVVVSIEQFATQTISVLGEVKSAGAYPIATPRSILDVLALAGGLTPLADRHILIEQHSDPAHALDYFYSNNAHQAIERQVLVSPGDTVLVAKAGIIYVLGDVNRPGGYAMTNNESQLTALQAIALAGGLSKTAKEGQVSLIRQEPGGAYSEKQLSASRLQQGKESDIPLHAGDVLYVPFSYGKNLAIVGAGSIAGAAASAAVYSIP